jgi:L-threonylcarbamoyladenylate synthase
MFIIKLTPKSRPFALEAALHALKRGGVIAFATETVYGIGCDPRRPAALRRMAEIKGRNEKKPFQLIAGSTAQVRAIADLNRFEKRLASKYWPGALTLLVQLKRSIRLPPSVAPEKIIGIRATPDTFLRDLTNALGFPIAATSANRSGVHMRPATSGRGVLRAFGKSYESRPSRAEPRGITSHELKKIAPNAKRKMPNASSAPDLLIDAGALPKRKPSTVARVSEDGRVEVMRQGGIRVG